MSDNQPNWSAEDEARRLSYIAAGLEPQLFSYWRGEPTGRLQACLDELLEKFAPGEDWTVDDTIGHLRRELEYREAT